METRHAMNLFLLLLLALLTSCGGSGGSTAADSGGIGGTGLTAHGTITAFGSIVVNGTEFDTSEAAIIVEGEEVGIGDDVALNNLDIGRVVTVEGSGSEEDNSAVADRVTYNDDVEGPVESIRDINTTTKEIVVLGQTVVVNVITKLKETTFDTLARNDMVEVSGLVDDTGVTWATFLEKTGEFMPGTVVEVTGFVENLDTALETFDINDLAVDYSFADTTDLPGGVLTDGLLVEVEGTLDATGGQMLATDIGLGDQLSDEDVGQIEVMGFVTDFISVFNFTVGNQVVRTDADTVFVDGTRNDIAPGVKLEAEGSLSDGVLFAEEIEFWEPDQIEVEGFVTDVVSVSEFTVGNQVVRTDAGTVYEGGTPDDIALGVLIEIKGVPADIMHSVLVADKVSFEDE
jgi:surface antigen